MRALERLFPEASHEWKRLAERDAGWNEYMHLLSAFAEALLRAPQTPEACAAVEVDSLLGDEYARLADFLIDLFPSGLEELESYTRDVEAAPEQIMLTWLPADVEVELKFRLARFGGRLENIAPRRNAGEGKWLVVLPPGTRMKRKEVTHGQRTDEQAVMVFPEDGFVWLNTREVGKPEASTIALPRPGKMRVLLKDSKEEDHAQTVQKTQEDHPGDTSSSPIPPGK
jgi:hypothetical protein